MKKRDTRKLWILSALLDCDKWSQTDIMKLWSFISAVVKCDEKAAIFINVNNDTKHIPGYIKSKIVKKLGKKYKLESNEELFHIPNEEVEKKFIEEFKEIAIDLMSKNTYTYKNVKTIRKKCSSDISIIIKLLKERGIIKEETITREIDTKYAGSTVSVYSLVETDYALYQVLSIIKDKMGFSMNRVHKDLFLRNLIDSNYLKRVLNKNLLDVIEDKLFLNLNENDKKLLLFCLRRYPSVLHRVLKTVHDPFHSREYKKNNQKYNTNQFMLELKNWAYEDMKDDHMGIDFEITLKIRNKKGDTEEIIEHSNNRVIDEKIRRNDQDVLKSLGVKSNEGENLESLIEQSLVERKKQNAIYNEKRKMCLERFIRDKTLLVKDNGKKINFKTEPMLVDGIFISLCSSGPVSFSYELLPF